MTSLERDSALPLYYQLKQILLHQIQSGEVGPGEAFPSEKELEEHYGVSQITVRRALSDLASEGFISRQAGRGTFVLPRKIEHRSDGVAGIRDDLAASDMEVKSKILEFEVRTAPNHIAERLGVDKSHLLLYVRRLVFAGGEPFLITTGYHNLGEGVTFTREELESDSIFRLLERKYGMALSRVERVIEATLALDDEAELLDVRPNSPMLLAELRVYDAQGRPISFMKNIYRGDRYQYQHTTNL